MSDVESKVRAIYAQYNADKLGDVPRLMEKYRGNEAHLLESLQKKYGVSLSSDSEETRRHFSSVRALGEFVAAHRS